MFLCLSLPQSRSLLTLNGGKLPSTKVQERKRRGGSNITPFAKERRWRKRDAFARRWGEEWNEERKSRGSESTNEVARECEGSEAGH
ncbi:MAG: hypothetical protein ACTS43_02460 [Candidatus Hodgkinia cicadicola]